ncbi:hypothetical protein [Brevibacillus brevis]|uniref:Uncharacterized protein n=1 Tax=Brevibacillus brevis TaxID=1393 RepID=A0ABY9TCL8_BREBE|nr:hypothetical protein [Brevibacillus brevis]WNC17860.1 hypothetical protein RGB73_30085 [Brevibacillus brevis]
MTEEPAVDTMTVEQADEIIRLLQKIDADSVARHQDYIAQAKTFEEIALYLLGCVVIALAGLVIGSFWSGWRSFR